MSRAAKLTLLGTSLFAAGTIVFVHYAQTAEKAVCLPSRISSLSLFPISVVHILRNLQAMHAGVIRDMEQQRIKKERQLDFDVQRAMEEEYRKVQNVSDGTTR